MKDDYAWLEDTNNPKVLGWARQQDQIARRSVKKYSDLLFKRMIQYYHRPIMRSVQLTKAGTLLFLSDDQSYRVQLVRRDGSRETIADSSRLGKDIVIQGVIGRDDGRRIALYYSKGGSDEGVVDIIDLESNRIIDHLDGFIGPVVWTKPDIFYYSRTFRKERTPDGVAPPAERVYLRTGREEDEMVFGRGLPTNTFLSIIKSQDCSKMLLDVGTWIKSRPYGGEIDKPETWVALYPEKDAIVQNIDYTGNQHFLLSYQKGLGEVLSIRSGVARRVVPEWKWPLQEVALLGTSLLCHYLVDAHSELRLFDLNGRSSRTIKFPVLGAIIQSANGHSISSLNDEAVIAFSSFALPFIVYRIKDGGRVDTVASEVLPGKFRVENGFAVSKDGTRIHYFLTRKKNVHPRKAVLFAYGGFGISTIPSFNPSFLPLLDDDCAYVVANLRGGLEHGEEWHRDGIREKKHHVFEDYLAVLAKLKRHGIDVVGYGRSNGGLLMGAAMNLRPDLFAGVVIGYPVLDMMRYHKLLIGRAWMPEYGDPDNVMDRRFLMKYSPYHNIRSRQKYPPVFIYSGLRDDRVHPAHAFKYYSRLREYGGNAILRVETKSGHIGTTPEIRIREEADKLAFIYQVLGLSSVSTRGS